MSIYEETIMHSSTTADTTRNDPTQDDLAALFFLSHIVTCLLVLLLVLVLLMLLALALSLGVSLALALALAQARCSLW